MNRIMVMGASAGAGKSTFARKLGEALQLNVYHLDVYYWNPGWVEAPFEEFAAAQRDIVTRDQWIIEGNYGSTYDIRAENADTIIYLDLPLYTCLYRVLKRWLTNRGKTRSDMGAGCKEQMEWKFIKFIIATYHSRKKAMKLRLQDFQASESNRVVITLKGKKEIQHFLDRITISETYHGKDSSPIVRGL